MIPPKKKPLSFSGQGLDENRLNDSKGSPDLCSGRAAETGFAAVQKGDWAGFFVRFYTVPGSSKFLKKICVILEDTIGMSRKKPNNGYVMLRSAFSF